MADFFPDRLVGFPLGGGGPNPGQHLICAKLGIHAESKAHGKEGIRSFSEQGVAV